MRPEMMYDSRQKREEDLRGSDDNEGVYASAPRREKLMERALFFSGRTKEKL